MPLTPAAILVSLSMLLATGPASALQKVENYWVGSLSSPLFGTNSKDARRPDVVIYVPSKYRATPAVDLVFYFHGMRNCALNVAANKGCAGGGNDPGQSIISQFERSGLNAILVVLQGAYNRGANDLRLKSASSGFFRKFLLEEPEFTSALRQATGKGMAGLGKIWLAGHSGAYVPMQIVLKDGGLDSQIAGVILLDSLYSAADWTPAFTAWKSERPDARMVAICQDTAKNVKAVMAGLKAAGQTAWQGSASAAPATLRPEPFQFYVTGVPHPAIPGKFFGPLLTAMQKPAAAPVTTPKRK